MGTAGVAQSSDTRCARRHGRGAPENTGSDTPVTQRAFPSLTMTTRGSRTRGASRSTGRPEPSSPQRPRSDQGTQPSAAQFPVQLRGHLGGTGAEAASSALRVLRRHPLIPSLLPSPPSFVTETQGAAGNSSKWPHLNLWPLGWEAGEEMSAFSPETRHSEGWGSTQGTLKMRGLG